MIYDRASAFLYNLPGNDVGRSAFAGRQKAVDIYFKSESVEVHARDGTNEWIKITIAHVANYDIGMLLDGAGHLFSGSRDGIRLDVE